MPRTKFVIWFHHRSGSSHPYSLLDSHPEICSVGELKVGALGDLENYLCSCRRKIVTCPFWSEVRAKFRSAGEEFELDNPGTDIRVTDNKLIKRLLRPMVKGRLLELLRDALLFFIPEWHKHASRVRKRNYNFLSVLASLSGAAVVADSSKVGVRLKFLLRDSYLDVRVIRLIRDGRGVALTYINPSEFADAKAATLRGGGTGNENSHVTMTMPEAADEWVRANEEAESLRSILNEEQYLEIHYEDLCTNTIETMNSVYRFLGVSPLASQVIRDVDRVEHHIVGNGMRLDDDHTIILDERWRTQLTAQQLSEFQAVAGEKNTSYGYE